MIQRLSGLTLGRLVHNDPVKVEVDFRFLVAEPTGERPRASTEPPEMCSQEPLTFVAEVYLIFLLRCFW
jgi:hypothetical protein